ncbi:MAG: CDP-alcohol phosphatidyltransferase family protein [Vulcanimicrobiota bacterium]
MASVYQLKSQFQKLLRPLTGALAKAGVTANGVTVAALVLSAAMGAACWLISDPRVLYLVPLGLFLRMALNAIDGMLAREHGQKSALGGFLNELGDVLSDAFLYMPLALRAEFPLTATLLFCFLGVLTEFTGVVAVSQGASRRYDGPMGKSDRAFLFGATGLALAYGAPSFAWVSALMWLGVLLSFLTVARRIGRSLEELEE